jgi:hypothetical protein
MVRVSTSITGAATVDEAAAVALLGSFLCSPTTLSAVPPHISQVLQRVSKFISSEDRHYWYMNQN